MPTNILRLTTLALLLAGCGGVSDAPKLAPVQGTASWQGKPLENASVVFTPESGPIAVGNTDAQGAFVLTTHGKTGASLGAHRVTIAAFEPVKTPASAPTAPAGPDGEIAPPLKSRIPVKYTDLKQTDLKATVVQDSGSNDFRFDLK